MNWINRLGDYAVYFWGVGLVLFFVTGAVRSCMGPRQPTSKDEDWPSW